MTSTREARAAGNADATTAAARSRSAEAATGNASGHAQVSKVFCCKIGRATIAAEGAGEHSG